MYTNFNQLAELDETANQEFQRYLKLKKFKKGEYLLEKGQVCRYIFFIQEGLVKICFTKETKEFIMRFFAENSIVTVIDSYFKQSPSAYDVLALEKTTVACIAKTDLDRLCNENHSAERALRKLVTQASMNMMERVSEMLEENAGERYAHFLALNGRLVNRISLGDLASYLGITQVSLSRIRAKK